MRWLTTGESKGTPLEVETTILRLTSWLLHLPRSSSSWLLNSRRSVCCAFSQAKLTSSHFDAVSGKIDAVMTTVSKHCETSSSTAPLTSQPSSVWSDLFKKSLDEHEYDSKAEKTIVVYNIDKATDYLRKDENLNHVINSLSTSHELLFWTPS